MLSFMINYNLKQQTFVTMVDNPRAESIYLIKSLYTGGLTFHHILLA